MTLRTHCVNDTNGDGDCAACARNPEAPCRRADKPESAEEVRAFVDALRSFRAGGNTRTPDRAVYYRREGEINALDAVLRYIESGEIPREMLFAERIG